MLQPTEYVIFQHNFTQKIDRARVIPGSDYKNSSDAMLDGNSNHGDWYSPDDSNMVSFIGMQTSVFLSELKHLVVM